MFYPPKKKSVIRDWVFNVFQSKAIQYNNPGKALAAYIQTSPAFPGYKNSMKISLLHDNLVCLDCTVAHHSSLDEQSTLRS